jgi:CheY-like chemotaxis protein
MHTITRVSIGGAATASGLERHSRPGALIVDDDAAIRETLAHLVEEGGYDVLTAHNGLLALKILQTSTRPLVALLDAMMPGMSGMEVVNRVAADGRLAHRHACILMTANPEALPLALVQRLKHLSVPVIAKPFDLDTLLALIERAAERVAIA